MKSVRIDAQFYEIRRSTAILMHTIINYIIVTRIYCHKSLFKTYFTSPHGAVPMGPEQVVDLCARFAGYTYVESVI